MNNTEKIIKSINESKRTINKTPIYDIDFNNMQLLKIVNEHQHNKIKNAKCELSEEQQNIYIYFCKKLAARKDNDYKDENGNPDLGGDGIFKKKIDQFLSFIKENIGLDKKTCVCIYPQNKYCNPHFFFKILFVIFLIFISIFFSFFK